MSTSFPLDGLRVRFAGETDVGRKRTHNEDNFFLPDDDRLAIVADGMGGHASGEVASQIAVDAAVEYFKATAEEAPVTWPFKVDRGNRQHVNRLVIAIKLANLKVYEAAQRDAQLHGMGTTLVSIYFLDDQALIGHVGDSRAYRIREEEIAQITEDHSLLNDYLKMKRLTPTEAASFSQKNVIVRALGMKDSVQVDVFSEAPRLGDIYVLCSDGLSGMLTDDEIRDIARAEPDLDKACEKLIAAANGAGGVDNITVVLARIEPL
ncbi:MAG TPA: Stp1/IreP family PP2C-type Ser/Thr phosphatase [Polyangia bacterium]|jgi:protein phosphatase